VLRFIAMLAKVIRHYHYSPYT